MEPINLIISVIAFSVSLLTYFQKNNYDNKIFKYQEDNDNKRFINEFKDELNQFRIGIGEVISIEQEIDIHEKDSYLYLLESKYSDKDLKAHLGIDIYNNFLDLKIKIDNSINKIIYQKDFSSAKESLKFIRFLHNDINTI